MKANLLLKANIRALLAARRQQQSELARWVRPGAKKADPWLSQILRSSTREFQTQYLDRIADFFGVAVYQLFQPGISRLAERRSAVERRSGRDRRIGRALQIDAVPPPHPTPEEWLIISRFRKYQREDSRAKLIEASEYLLLREGTEATIKSSVDPKGTTRRVKRALPRARKGSVEDPPEAAAGTNKRP